MVGRSSNRTPGARTRRGPANETGLARLEYTGSISTLVAAA